MMIFLGWMIQEQKDSRKSSRHRPMDIIDLTLMWVIKVCLIILYLTIPQLVVDATNQQQPDESFFFLCSGGQIEELQSALEQNSEWTHARTENGETCLHLAGIRGFSSVTKLLLEKGADPDVRTTYEMGLRMHPLSWNVYGGHVDNVALLLEHGADVNADFDSMNQEQGPVTALDIVLQLKKNEEGDERFEKMETVLRKHGAKTMVELAMKESSDTDTEL